MDGRKNTIQAVLAAMNFDQDRIQAAITALEGTAPQDRHDDEPILTPKQLCAHLKISLTTLWRLKPPFLVVGARKRFSLREVREFLAKREGGVA